VHAGKTLKRGTMPGTAPATVAKQQHQTIGFET